MDEQIPDEKITLYQTFKKTKLNFLIFLFIPLLLTVYGFYGVYTLLDLMYNRIEELSTLIITIMSFEIMLFFSFLLIIYVSVIFEILEIIKFQLNVISRYNFFKVLKGGKHKLGLLYEVADDYHKLDVPIKAKSIDEWEDPVYGVWNKFGDWSVFGKKKSYKFSGIKNNNHFEQGN